MRDRARRRRGPSWKRDGGGSGVWCRKSILNLDCFNYITDNLRLLRIALASLLETCFELQYLIYRYFESYKNSKRNIYCLYFFFLVGRMFS